jgi:UDP-glucose 4-epimerase
MGVEMKILVTGGAGFIGTNLIKRLLKDGHEVTSVDNYSTGFEKNHQDGCQYYNYDISSEHTLGIYVDVATYPSWRDEEYDVIYHMAALARIQPSLENPHPTLVNNFLSTLNILEYARKTKTPIVYAGSSSIHHGLFESPYAWSKFSGEDLCKLYSNVYKVPTSICRFYNVYGDYQIKEGTYATVLGIFQKQYEDGKPLTVVSPGTQRRDFTHVEDIVDGIIKSSEKEFYGEIFELGRGVNHSISEVANMFTGHPTVTIPVREGEYDVTLADPSHAKEVLGWTPTKNLKDYMENYINETN